MAGLGLAAAAAAALAQAVGLELQHAQLVLGQPGAGIVERRVAEQAATLVEAGGARRLLQLERRLRGLAPGARQLEELGRLAVVALDRQQLGALVGAGRGVALGHGAEGGAEGRLDRQALVADLRRQTRRALEVAGPQEELRRLVLAARGDLLLGERAVVAGEQRQELRLRHVDHSRRSDVDFNNSIAPSRSVAGPGPVLTTGTHDQRFRRKVVIGRKLAEKRVRAWLVADSHSLGGCVLVADLS